MLLLLFLLILLLLRPLPLLLKLLLLLLQWLLLLKHRYPNRCCSSNAGKLLAAGERGEREPRMLL